MFIDNFNAIVVLMLYVYLTMAFALMMYTISEVLSERAEEKEKEKDGKKK